MARYRAPSGGWFRVSWGFLPVAVEKPVDFIFALDLGFCRAMVTLPSRDKRVGSRESASQESARSLERAEEVGGTTESRSPKKRFSAVSIREAGTGRLGAKAHSSSGAERDGPEKSIGFGREATRGLLRFFVATRPNAHR